MPSAKLGFMLSPVWLTSGMIMMVLAGPLAASDEELKKDLAVANRQIETLKEANEQLRELCREALKGRKFESLEVKDGEVLHDVEVMEVKEDMLRLRYDDRGSIKVELVKIDDGPESWRYLLPLEEEVLVRDERMVTKGAMPGQDVARSIVVIEGDAGVGTGFLAENDGAVYLYTAAHVLSGNKKLTVKRRNGRKITSFGKFEASEGADLVRIEVKEEVENPLKLASSLGQAREDMVVYAAGNSGGGGTVGFEKGLIQGVGAESIEIDADVIQGNSGGPILDAETHEVLGVVTHLVAARKDKWAKETRYSEVRRFGCRVDREWEWRELPIGAFLREGQALKEVTDLNELFILAMSPSEWDSPRLRDFGDHRVVKEIKALQDWIEKRKRSATGVSVADRKKKVAALFEGMRAASKQQLRSFKPGRYVWFHREMAEQAMKLREELDAECDEAIEDLR